MPSIKIVSRLAVTLIAGLATLLCLAYWWLDNRTHELAGAVLLAVVGRHLYLNRSWFANLRRGRYDARRRLGVLIQCVVATNLAILAATSIAISQTVFAPLGVPDNVAIRDLHWVSAYWFVITVGLHLGLQWSRLMLLLRSAFRISGSNALRTWMLRTLTAMLLALGIWSLMVLEVGTKLTWNFSINFWDFSRSVWPFFMHWGSVMAVPAIVTHYALTLAARLPAERQAT